MPRRNRNKPPRIGEKRIGLDRIDNNRGYEPGNVRWASQRQQMRNTRRTIFVNIGGAILSLPELSEKTGIRQTTLRSRINRGFGLDRLTMPVMSYSQSASLGNSMRTQGGRA